MTQTPVKPEAVDRFVHLTDLHFWQVEMNPLHLMNKRFLGNLTVIFRRRHEFVMERAESFADEVAATGVSTVLVTGDFVSIATDEEYELAAVFMRGLRARGLTVYTVAGNHDVYTFGSQRARRFERYLGEFLAEDGAPALIRLPGGTPLILFPSACPRLLSARGRVTLETVGRVRELLQECGPAAFLAAHYPFLHSTHGYASHLLRRLQNAASLRRMLGESGKRILYVAGHVHRFSYECDDRYPDVEQLTTGAFFRTSAANGTDGEFTEVSWDGADFDVVRHLCRGEWAVVPGSLEEE